MSKRRSQTKPIASKQSSHSVPAQDHRVDQSADHGFLHISIAAFIIVLLTTIAYISSFRGVFLFDDIRHIAANADLRGPDALMHALQTDRPLVAASFVMNVWLAKIPLGQPIHPFGFHVVNLLIHCAAALVLFGIVRRTLLLPIFDGRFAGRALPIAFAVASIWAVHPLQTQSVTYIVQRGESLMGLCYLLTLYCYIRGALAQRNSHLWYIVCILICAAGMASKAVMVTAPLLVVLYDRCFLSQSWVSITRKRWPIMLCLAGTWIMLIIVGVAPGILSTDAKVASVGFSYENKAVEGATWWHYFLTQPLVILHYLKLSVWPSPLILDYYWPLEKSLKHAIAPLIAVALLGLATLWLLWKKPALGFVAAAFFIILAPTSSIVPIKDAIFEHRMYLPLASVVTLAVLGVASLLHRWWSGGNISITARRLTVAIPLIVLLAALSTLTYARNLDYQSAERMWRDAISKQPSNLRAMNNLGAELIAQADASRDPQEIARLRSEACELFRAIISQDMAAVDLPEYAVQYNVANCYVNEGNIEAALPFFEAAITNRPRFIKAHINYANALSKLGRHAEAADRFRAAAAAGKMERADERLLIARAQYNLGNELFRLKQYDAAIEAYQSSATTHSDYAKAYFMIGQCWELLNDAPRAKQAYQTLLQLLPNHAEGRQRLQVLQ